MAKGPLQCKLYWACSVNGVKFVAWDKDKDLRTQNSGVMVETSDAKYYGVLEQVVELIYATCMPVVLFKCKWFDTDPENSGSTKVDMGLLSVDTNSSWYEDSPFCLARSARQVFYVDDPKAGDAWKVVNVMSHRNVYDPQTLATRGDDLTNEVEEAYQEIGPVIYFENLNLAIDLEMEEEEEEDDDDEDEDEDEHDEDEDEDDDEDEDEQEDDEEENDDDEG